MGRQWFSNAKLNEKQVVEILLSTKPTSVLAREYNLSPHHNPRSSDWQVMEPRRARHIPRVSLLLNLP